MANTGAFWSRTQECPWRLQSCPAQHPSPPRGFCPGSRVWTDAHQGDTLRRQPMDRSQRRTECPGKRALHTQVAAGQPQSACWVRAESGPVGAPCEDERRSQGSECSLLSTPFSGARFGIPWGTSHRPGGMRWGVHTRQKPSAAGRGAQRMPGLKGRQPPGPGESSLTSTSHLGAPETPYHMSHLLNNP